jgi:hypothetical protein
VLADLRYAVRLLGRAPAFALAATATIALAVAGIVAIVSVIYGLLFRPLLVPGADRVMVIGIVDSRLPGTDRPASFPQYRDRQDSVAAFERLAAVTHTRFDVTGGGPAERLAGEVVSDNVGRPEQRHRPRVVGDCRGRDRRHQPDGWPRIGRE